MAIAMTFIQSDDACDCASTCHHCTIELSRIVDWQRPRLSGPAQFNYPAGFDSHRLAADGLRRGAESGGKFWRLFVSQKHLPRVVPSLRHSIEVLVACWMQALLRTETPLAEWLTIITELLPSSATVNQIQPGSPKICRTHLIGSQEGTAVIAVRVPPS